MQSNKYRADSHSFKTKNFHNCHTFPPAIDLNTMAGLYIPIKPNQVRLVKFGHDGNHTTAIIQTFSLEGPIPPYLALSYTWSYNEAGATRSHTLQIGEQRLQALDSLQ